MLARGTAGRRSEAPAAWRRRRGCRRSPRARRAGSRRSRDGRRWPTRKGRAGGRRWSLACSVGLRVVDVEVVQPAGGAIAPEARGVDVLDARALEQLGHLGDVLVAHRLLDAVRTEALYVAAHVEARLVDRVAQRLACIPADHQAPG